jgi:ATP-dependent DNA helicase RecG
MIIERGQVRTENSNKPHGFGVLNPETFTLFPKNPFIAAFFRQIGRADELGSGMRKLIRYGKAYGGADPELIEGDIFRIVVKVPEFGAIGEVTPGVSSKHPASTAQVTAQVGEFCREPRSSKEIMAMLKLKHWKTFQSNYLNPLMDAGFIERTIPDKPSRLSDFRLIA